MAAKKEPKESDREFADRMVDFVKKAWWASDDTEVGIIVGLTVGDLRRLVNSYRLSVEDAEFDSMSVALARKKKVAA